MRTRPRILVIGSLNVDHTLRVSQLPKPGETVTASELRISFGGKGANQAIAASRAGGDVTLLGCVGQDSHAQAYRDYLAQEHIRTDLLVQETSCPTGSAFITVDAAAENSIVVYPGANHALRPPHIDACSARLASIDALLLQCECPLERIAQAVSLAHSKGVRVVLNPSPWNPLWETIGLPVDFLIVNAHEAQSATGLSPESAFASPAQACANAKCEWLIITRGHASTLALSASGTSHEVHPPTVHPVDTVGAGDAFAGAFTVALCEGKPLPDCLAFGNVAGALTTLQPGAQQAIPHRTAILHALGSLPSL